ncbi:hypothetical protein BH23ACT6_BH23ACT6_16780 [soil metagenome]
MDLQSAAVVGHRLLKEHGLAQWRLVFDNASTRFGVCRPRRREIGLSRRLTQLSSEAEVRNTLLHEIAHALVGPAHGHDVVWRAKALAIGCDGKRTDDIPAGAEGQWEGRCAAGHVVRRHRRPRRVGSCRLCSTSFDLQALYAWTYQGQWAPMLPAYEAELARLRRQHGIPAGPGGFPGWARSGGQVDVAKSSVPPGMVESMGVARPAQRASATMPSSGSQA